MQRPGPNLSRSASRPYAQSTAAVRNIVQHRFHESYLAASPRLAKAKTVVTQAYEQVLEPLVEDGDLTDSGRRRKATERLKLPLDDLRKLVRDVKSDRAKRAKARAELAASRTPQAPDLNGTLRFLIGLMATQNDAAARKMFIESAFTVTPGAGPTPENLVALSLPAATFGATGEAMQNVLRHRLGVFDLGHEGQALDDADRIAEIEETVLRESLAALASAGDVAALVEAGFLEKPYALMSEDERTAFAREHGGDELMRLAMGDRALFGDFVPAEDEEEKPATGESTTAQGLAGSEAAAIPAAA